MNLTLLIKLFLSYIKSHTFISATLQQKSANPPTLIQTLKGERINLFG